MSAAGVALGERLVMLITREVKLRESARRIELDPSRTQEAARLFRRASQVRAERLAELRCLGVL
jgi:hypothetical protein